MCRNALEMSKNLTSNFCTAAKVSNVFKVAAPGVGVYSSSFGFFFMLKGRAHTLDFTPSPRASSTQVTDSNGPSTAPRPTSSLA